MADKVYPLRMDAPAPPPPASHGHQQHKSFSQKQPPLPLSSHRLPGRSVRRCCNPCFCCCASWICSWLVSLVVLIGIVALLLYLILRPKEPKFSVTDAYVSTFNLTSKPLEQSAANLTAPAYLQTDMNFTIEATNRNKRIGFYADQIDATLSYDKLQIGNGSIPSFYLGHKAVKELQLEMIGKDTPLTESTDPGLQTAVTNGSNIQLEIMTVTRGRIKVWWWKSRHFKVRLKCDVLVNGAVTGKSTQLLSNSCKWKVVRFWL